MTQYNWSMTAGTQADVRAILKWMTARASQRNVDGMARYGIVAKKVFGISVGTLRAKGKQIGRDHALAIALWKTGWYEARMLAALIDDPKTLTPAQMDRWANAFDNWAICDTVCFHLFDKTPHAWGRVNAWHRSKHEFVRRAAFALIASLGVHDKKADDELFLRCLPKIRAAATDDRNFVKKAVNWALRTIGKRNPRLYDEVIAVATELAGSRSPTARWIGKDALRDLNSPASLKRLRKQSATTKR